MDALLLGRIQFAMTVGFHFIFPPISIGLAWLLVLIEILAWRTRLEVYERLGRFFGKILALTFALGVATGITMEFQFGTNWSRYSAFVGDIFGAPLAAEAVIAFFLESSFLGLYIFGRNRVPKGVHVLSIVMVAIGSCLSAFWILVANSWMQTPAGYVFNEAAGRAELTDFWAAVFNPSTLPRVHHTVAAALVCGSFMMAGICAYLLRRNFQDAMARRGMTIAVIAGLVSSILVAFPFGHIHAQQVARTQPAKFAAIEGLYTTQSGAPLVVFAIPFTRPPELKASVEVPKLLSWLAFGDINATIPGIEEFPEEDRPPLWLTFVSFHNMVALGMWFILLMLAALVQRMRRQLWVSRKLLWWIMISIPLPVLACELGWMTAEVGRQPWIVQGLMRTADAHSDNVPAGQVMTSLILFGVLYTLLGILYVYLLCKKVREQASHNAEQPAAEAALVA